MYLSYIFCLMSFDNYIHMYYQHPKQNKEFLYHPGNFPHNIFQSNPFSQWQLLSDFYHCRLFFTILLNEIIQYILFCFLFYSLCIISVIFFMLLCVSVCYFLCQAVFHCINESQMVD